MREHLLALVLMIFISGVISSIYHGDRLNLEVLNPIACLGLLYASERIGQSHFRFSLVAVLGVIFILMQLGIDIDESVIVVGQNGLTLHMLVLYAAYFFKNYRESLSVLSRGAAWENYCIVSVMFSVSVWSQSRAATIVSFILLCAAAWMVALGAQWSRRLLIFVVTFFVVWVNYSAPMLMGKRPYSGIDRIGFSSSSEIRYRVWADYFQTLSPARALLGNRASNCHRILQGYTQDWCNVHNSYLRAHQVYGFFGIFAISMVASISFLGLWHKRDIYAAIVFFLILLRVMADEHFFTHSCFFLSLIIFLRATNTPCHLLERGK